MVQSLLLHLHQLHSPVQYYHIIGKLNYSDIVLFICILYLLS